MLFHCAFSRLPGVSRLAVRQRAIHLHRLATNRPDCIEACYSFGGGSGVLIVDVADAMELSTALAPYEDLLAFQVQAISSEINYEELFGLPVATLEAVAVGR
jgi:hypothetical protein